MGGQLYGVENVNYTYFVEFIRSLPGWERLKVLDYGCGSGQLVEVLRGAGIDAVGCDVYYEGGGDPPPELKAIRDRLMAEGVIRHVTEEGPLPFPEATFDVIVSNQVFEHVRDLVPTVERVRRVLKPDGVALLHFPSLEVIREGHIGIPFAHRLPRGRFRHVYTTALRRAGLGYFKAGKPVDQWVDDALAWIDAYCFYRPYGEIRGVLDRHFEVQHHELPYIRYRGASRPWLRGLLSVPGTGALWASTFRRLAFMALLLRPRPVPGESRMPARAMTGAAG
jgi:SAM-dependent methyltransferase